MRGICENEDPPSCDGRHKSQGHGQKYTRNVLAFEMTTGDNGPKGLAVWPGTSIWTAAMTKKRIAALFVAATGLIFFASADPHPRMGWTSTIPSSDTTGGLYGGGTDKLCPLNVQPGFNDTYVPVTMAVTVLV